MRWRYQRWDGRQDPLGARPDVAELLDRIGDDLLMGAGGRDALAELRRRGLPGVRGTESMRRELARRRRELQQELDADGPLGELAQELDEIIGIESEALSQRDDDDATFDQMRLDALPPDPAGRFRELSNYDFSSPEAAERFAELGDKLRKDLLDAHLKSLTGALESVTQEDVQRIAAMLGDLNKMLEARAANGGDPPPDEAERFEEFKAKHGDLLPGDPADLDELLAEMARRAAAAEQFMRALSPEQREQLQQLAREAFDDLDLEFQLSQLGGNLAGAFPDGPPASWGQPGPGEPGDEPEVGEPSGPISQVVDAWERVAELEDLEQQLAGSYEGATLDDIDEEALRRHLGEDAAGDVRELRKIEQELERSGAMRVKGGELELTPRGARLLGERALAKLMARVRREPSTRVVGADPEMTGQTRAWAFGDREPLSVSRTLHEAVLREVGEGRDPDGRVQLQAADLQVAETEVRPRTATALLLDLSFSMPLQGHFVPAKRMALALHALIEGKHRQDSLHLIGFSDYARRMQPADLAAAGFERVYGTNMHHAFQLARRVLADDPRQVKRVIMVTDGEPTSHLVHGRSVFHWPPVPETLEVTLREAMRLARLGIELDVFLLEDEPGLVAFSERLAQLTGGEVVRMSAEDVGRTVVSGYGRWGPSR